MKLKSVTCALLSMLALCNCASRPTVQPVAVSCPVPPPPPAWMMAPASNSMQLLDRIITTSAPPSPTTRK